MNLYDIDSMIMSLIDEETGEIIDLEAFDKLQMDQDQKIENLACFIKDLDAEATALDTEIKNLQARKKATANKANNLRNYLAGFLNGQPWTSARAKITWRKNQGTVEVKDPSKLTDKYLRYADPELNKTAIRDALKNGTDSEIMEAAGATIEGKGSLSMTIK